MNVRELLESNFLSVQNVKDSPTKKVVILSAGVLDEYQGKKSLKLLVEIDGKQKFWRVNKLSLDTLSKAYGDESTSFVGKIVDLILVTVSGRECISVIPHK